jgi:hypothetical protein
LASVAAGLVLLGVRRRQAERSFVTATQIARSHGATSLELRATLSLHRVVSGAGKTRARDELARLLTLVAGGEGTPDVAEARRVVGELDGLASRAPRAVSRRKTPVARRKGP